MSLVVYNMIPYLHQTSSSWLTSAYFYLYSLQCTFLCLQSLYSSIYITINNLLATVLEGRSFSAAGYRNNLLVYHGDTLFKCHKRSRQDFKKLQSDFSTNSQWFAERDLSSKQAWRVSGVPLNYLQTKPLTKRGAKLVWVDRFQWKDNRLGPKWMDFEKIGKRIPSREMQLNYYI